MLDAEIIKQRISILALLERLGIEQNRAGFISCPAHADNTPSLKIYPESDSFYCFSCAAGGSVIDFYMLYADVDFVSANKGLAGLFGLTTDLSREDRRQLLRIKRKPRQDTELEYWTRKYLAYRAALNEDHEGWNPRLEEACQKIGYAEYRMEVAHEEMRLNKLK